jgi:argininosuccinate lyase
VTRRKPPATSRLPKDFFQAPSDFIESIGFDHRLAAHDLRASLAHAEMLGRRRIIPAADARKIQRGLKTLSARAAKGERLPRAEDVHYAIELALRKLIGPAAGRLHTARSRNDQTVTAFRLYVRERVDLARSLLSDTAAAFLAQAEAAGNAVMPGFTHLQPAQPILAAHHFLAYAWMFLRDRDRLNDLRRRVNVLPLGAAALAGTSFPIDRSWVAKRLGFEAVCENSLDAVSDRDFAVEYVAALALVMAHLSRLAEELVVWSHPSFGFVTLADPFVSGSSIMPQKRNPDAAELLRGKTGRVYGDLMALLTLIKAQPLAYNRDMQEDKPPVFDAADTAEAALRIAAPMVRTWKIHPDKMRRACSEGRLLATEAADGLARRGVPFREAHAAVAAVAEHARKNDLPLEEVPLAAWRARSPVFGPWLKEALSLDRAVAARVSAGGTAPSSVRRQMAELRRRLRRGA